MTTIHPLASTTGKTVLLALTAAALVAGLHFWTPSRIGLATLENSIERAPTPVALPFSLEDATNYFVDAMGGPPNERHANYAMFEGGRTGDGLFNITMVQRGPEILVRFQVIDDYGMNFIRELFEAPFFLRHESEQLYVLLYMGEGIHCATLPRFDVVFEHDARPEQTVVTLFFSPPVRMVK